MYAAAAGISAASSVITAVIVILAIIANWKLFEKAGEEGWKSIIPLYNTYIAFKIAWGNGWLFLLCLVPFANIVILIIFEIKLAESFGKSGGFIAGMILLPSIFDLILGFDDSRYIGPNGGKNNNGSAGYDRNYYNQENGNYGNGGYANYNQSNGSYGNNAYSNYNQSNNSYENKGYGNEARTDSSAPSGRSQNVESGRMIHVREEQAATYENREQNAAPSQPEKKRGHFCPNCGQPVPETAKFCPKCGHPLPRREQ